MFDAELLKILRCPKDHSELSLASPELVLRTNDKIRAGRLYTTGGQLLKKPIDGGLVRAAGDLLYPIMEGIPVMLGDEAIDVSQFQSEK